MRSSNLSSNTSSLKSEEISFYNVPLECTVVPEIGCGSKTKPVLLKLEKQKKAPINGAWLNHTGTVIAIVWESNTSKESRENVVEEVFRKNNIPVIKSDGKEHQKLLDDFRTGSAWYRGKGVDELSNEEAEIIAERLINRVSNKISISKEKQQIPKKLFSRQFKEEFTQTFSSDINTGKEDFFEPILKRITGKLLDIGRLNLNTDQYEVLNEEMNQKHWFLEQEQCSEACES